MTTVGRTDRDHENHYEPLSHGTGAAPLQLSYAALAYTASLTAIWRLRSDADPDPARTV
jgi:hypothetical protein